MGWANANSEVLRCVLPFVARREVPTLCLVSKEWNATCRKFLAHSIGRLIERVGERRACGEVAALPASHWYPYTTGCVYYCLQTTMDSYLGQVGHPATSIILDEATEILRHVDAIPFAAQFPTDVVYDKLRVLYASCFSALRNFERQACKGVRYAAIKESATSLTREKPCLKRTRAATCSARTPAEQNASAERRVKVEQKTNIEQRVTDEQRALIAQRSLPEQRTLTQQRSLAEQRVFAEQRALSEQRAIAEKITDVVKKRSCLMIINPSIIGNKEESSCRGSLLLKKEEVAPPSPPEASSAATPATPAAPDAAAATASTASTASASASPPWRNVKRLEELEKRVREYTGRQATSARSNQDSPLKCCTLLRELERCKAQTELWRRKCERLMQAARSGPVSTPTLATASAPPPTSAGDADPSPFEILVLNLC